MAENEMMFDPGAEDQFEEMDLVYDLDRMEELEEEEEEDTDALQYQIGSDSASDALISCLREQGVVSLYWMKRASGLSIEELVERLGGKAIFQDPDLLSTSSTYQLHRGWVLAANYLSGNLRQKLIQAKAFNEKYPGKFQANIDALTRRLPPRVAIEDIHLSLGATWIPCEMYADFIADLLETYEKGEVIYEPTLGLWRHTFKSYMTSYIDNSFRYGTADLSALKIIEQTLNARTVKVYDRFSIIDEDGKVVTRSILNREHTQEAQDKQKKICEEFENWCMSDVFRMEELENAYNEEFSSFGTLEYDGSFLDFPDMNPEITLHPHQKNAVARILLGDENVLLAHEVGTGKTFEMICAAHEMKRLHLAERILITMPNSVFQDFLIQHERLYPQDKIMAIRSADMTPKKREATLEKLKNSDFTVCYMAHSTFDRLKVSSRYWMEELKENMRQVKEERDQSSRDVRAMLDTRLRAMQRSLESMEKKAKENQEKEGICFDDLDFDALFVDEAHKYKNIPLQCQADNVVGLHTSGAAKCKEMVGKCHMVEKIVFATGTPLTNSIADLFVMQSYLQPDALAELHVDSFDQWISTFAQRETSFEVDVDSSHLRPVTRFSTFHNLPELMALFSTVCDFHYNDANQDHLPKFNGCKDLQVHKVPSQQVYIEDLAKRTEDVRERRVNRKEDNLLKITHDGRMAALDLRLLNLPLEPAETPLCKISICADQVCDLANRYPGCAQLVFSDIGTPKDTFNVYDELKAQLIERGMKPEEIAFIHDAPTEAARKKLFEKVNKGVVRVVVGSTEKLGTGVNVQERLIALHHLSVPWRPADMVQREGRIIRQGNTCDEVFIYRYITEGTFDSYSWQLLENKQRFISSFLAGSSKSRSMEDISDTVLSYAELKALAIGNPLIKKRVETANKLERTKTRFRQRQNQLQNLREELPVFPKRIREQELAARRIDRDIKHYQSHQRVVSRADRIRMGKLILKAANDAYYRYWYTIPKEIVSDFQGFKIFDAQDEDGEVLQIKIYGTYKKFGYTLDIKTDSPLGVMQSIEYLISHLPDRRQEHLRSAEQLKKSQASAREDLSKGNQYSEQIEQLQEELEKLDAKLDEIAAAEEEARKKQREENFVW